MVLSKLTTNPQSVIQGLDDVPLLTASALKAKFDEGAGLIKTYINDTLTTEIDAQIASVIAGETITTGAVGDGVTDDTAVIQAEITALPTNGKLLFGHGKTYLISSQLNLKSDITIEGNGSIIYVASVVSGSAKNIFDIAESSSPVVTKVNIIVRNFLLRSVADQTQLPRIGLTSNVSGIQITSRITGTKSNNILIENMVFENLLYGIKLDAFSGQNQDIKIKNIKSLNCVQPIYIDNTLNITLDDLDLDQATDVDTLDHHIYINTNTKNITFNNVILRRGSLDDDANAVIFAITTGITIENVIINNMIFEEVNNFYCLSFVGVKNISINNLNVKMKTGKQLIYAQKISDVIINGFNISGSTSGFIQENNVFAGYNNNLVFMNGVFNGTIVGSIFAAACTVKDCIFNVDFSSSNSRFLSIFGAIALKTLIQNNVINITARNAVNQVIFRIGSTLSTITIDSNRIENLSGDSMDYVFWQSTNPTDVLWINNHYKNIDTLFFAKNNAVTTANIKLTGLGDIIPLEFLTSVSASPTKIGLIAIVSSVVYMSTSTASTAGWKQLTN